MFLSKVEKRVAVGLTLATAAGFAMADGGVDITTVVAAVAAAAAAVVTIGGSVLAMKVGGKAYKWIGSFL